MEEGVSEFEIKVGADKDKDEDDVLTVLASRASMRARRDWPVVAKEWSGAWEFATWDEGEEPVGGGGMPTIGDEVPDRVFDSEDVVDTGGKLLKKALDVTLERT